MTVLQAPSHDTADGKPDRDSAVIPEKPKLTMDMSNSINPVLQTSEHAYITTALVTIDDEAVEAAAQHINERLEIESYTPRTWRSHALHICPPEPYDPSLPETRRSLDWLFLIASLNFSFWSELEGTPRRYGVEWREGWGSEKMVVHTGYWSLVAAIDRALEEGIPITDPAFYASETQCPDSTLAHVFRAAPQSTEGLPLLVERIAILRQNGAILCKHFGGSFQGFYDAFAARTQREGTALQLVKTVAETFPSFQDSTVYAGQRVYFWKRAQILVAETWAAFYPPAAGAPHPLFPGAAGPAMHELTMFADYRVPQVLHHLGLLRYPPALADALRAHTPLAPGAREEVSIRAASIVAVERVRRAMRARRADTEEISSVLIDFYLWDLAKRIEGGTDAVQGVRTDEILPAHRTRSIWY
ncbi:queuosine salvage family protein [Phanerochaete sordida]|uniref:Queuosine 5'-phosphate N-glycosylase/hydrolase n=1 Tax=Phanerochaete sordida TaxID=48140 RepID=A0A9P3GPV8_9APHY|nr:queuosine salvage family protein [Phanerochaete sordida]